MRLMQERPPAPSNHSDSSAISSTEHRINKRAAWIAAAAVVACGALIAAPSPAGLPEAGKRVLAVAVLAIALWCAEVLPAGVTGLILVVGLVLSGGVPGFPQALPGFADPVAYFLI